VITGEFPRKFHMMVMMEFFYDLIILVGSESQMLDLSFLIDLNRIHLLIDIYGEMCKVLKDQCVRV
jgi:hypothetical protein